MKHALILAALALAVMPAHAQTVVYAFYSCDASGCTRTHEFRSMDDCIQAGRAMGWRRFQCVPEIKR
jgi:hypothetical protein